MTNQFAQTLKTEAWLQKRDWDTTALTDLSQQYEHEIEKLRIETTREMISKLIRMEEEAKMWSTDSDSTARDRQLAQTDHNKIDAEIRRLVSTIDAFEILDFNTYQKYSTEEAIAATNEKIGR